MISSVQSLIHFVESVYALHRLGISQSTITQYGYACTSLEKFAGRPVIIAELTDDLILRWLQQRLHEVSPNTVKRERRTILTLWRWAARHGYNSTPPIDIPMIRVPQQPVVTWELNEVERVVVAARAQRGEMRGTGISRAAWWSSLILFLHWVAPRIRAALAVTPADLNMERRSVLLRADIAKTGEMQLLAVSDQALAAIAGHYCPHRERVWPYPYNGRQLWPQLKRILKAAGLPYDRTRMFHCFRRTCYTQTVKHGSRDIAQRQLGHRTDMSRYYEDRSKLNERQAAHVMPELRLPSTDPQRRLF